MKNLMLLFSLFMLNFLMAQKEVNWGPELDLPNNNANEELIGTVDNFTLFKRERMMGSIKKLKGLPYFENYNPDLDLADDEELILPPGREYLRTFQWNRKYYLLTYEFDSKANKYSFFMQEIERYYLERTGKKEKSIGTLVVGEGESNFHMLVTESPDKYSLGFCYWTDEPRTANSTTVRVRVINSKGKRAWSKSMKLPYGAGHLKIEDFILTNTDNAFVLLNSNGAKERLKVDEKAREIPDFVVAAFTSNGDSTRYFPHTLNDKLFLTAGISSFRKEEVSITGLYREGDGNQINGSFSIGLDSLGNVLYNNEKPYLDYNLPEMLKEERMEPKDEDKLWKTSNKIAKRNDGGYYIFTELNFKEEGEKQNRSVLLADEYYDIIVTSVKDDGSIAWSKVVPKYQKCDGVGNGSYSLYHVPKSNDILLLFNDSESNVGISDTAPATSYNTNSEGCITKTIVTDYGMIKREKLDEEQKNVYIYPQIAKNLDPYQPVFYVRDGKSKYYRIAKLIF